MTPDIGHKVSDDDGHTGWGQTRSEAEKALRVAQEHDVESAEWDRRPLVGDVLPGYVLGPRIDRETGAREEEARVRAERETATTQERKRASYATHQETSGEGSEIVGKLIAYLVVGFAILWFVFSVAIPLILMNIALIALIVGLSAQRWKLLLLGASILGASYVVLDYRMGGVTADFTRNVSFLAGFVRPIVYLNLAAGLTGAYLLIRELLNRRTAEPESPLAMSRTNLLAMGGLLAAGAATVLFVLRPPATVATTQRLSPTAKAAPPFSESQPVEHGLDLRGGMRLELELDQSTKVSADPQGDIQRAIHVLRKRIDDFGAIEPLIQQVRSDRIVVELAGITDPDRAKGIIQRSAFLEFRITDKTGALEKALPRMDRTLRDIAPADADTTTVGVFTLILQPSRTVGFEGLPGEFAVREAAFPRADSLLHLPEIRSILPRNVDLLWMAQPVSVGASQYRLLYIVEDNAIVTGTNVVGASAAIDPLTNKPVVRFEFDRAGAQRFSEETGRHVGDYLTTVLDGRVYGRPPVIQGRTDGNGQITLGNRSLQEAQDLALMLRAGALPLPLRIVSSRRNP